MKFVPSQYKKDVKAATLSPDLMSSANESVGQSLSEMNKMMSHCSTKQLKLSTNMDESAVSDHQVCFVVNNHFWVRLRLL